MATVPELGPETEIDGGLAEATVTAMWVEMSCSPAPRRTLSFDVKVPVEEYVCVVRAVVLLASS